MPRRSPPITARANKHATDRLLLNRLDEEDIIPFLDRIDGDPFVLVLDRVQDPHNLGACLRSANAAGVHLVIAPKDHASRMTETVRQIACGGADDLPYVQVVNLGRTLDRLREAGFWIVGTGDEASQAVYETPLGGPLIFIMGAEGTGIRAKTASKCDALVSIPMLGSVECLNVSVATGVCLFEAVRQRLGGAPVSGARRPHPRARRAPSPQASLSTSHLLTEGEEGSEEDDSDRESGAEDLRQADLAPRVPPGASPRAKHPTAARPTTQPTPLLRGRHGGAGYLANPEDDLGDDDDDSAFDDTPTYQKATHPSFFAQSKPKTASDFSEETISPDDSDDGGALDDDFDCEDDVEAEDRLDDVEVEDAEDGDLDETDEPPRK